MKATKLIRSTGFMWALILVLAPGCSHNPGQNNQNHGDIRSVEEILREPSRYNGQLISVSGFLTLGFENCILWADENAHQKEGTNKAIWIAIDGNSCSSLEISALNFAEPAILRGRINIENKGHLWLFPMTLEQVILPNKIKGRSNPIRPH